MTKRIYVSETLKFLINCAIDGRVTTYEEIVDEVISPIFGVFDAENGNCAFGDEFVVDVFREVTTLCTSRGLPILTSLILSKECPYPGRGFWRTIGLHGKVSDRSGELTILHNQCFNWFKGYTVGDTEYQSEIHKKLQAVYNYKEEVPSDCSSQYPEGPLLRELDAAQHKITTYPMPGLGLLDTWLRSYVKFTKSTTESLADDECPHDRSEVEYTVESYNTDRIVDIDTKFKVQKRLSIKQGQPVDLYSLCMTPIEGMCYDPSSVRINGIKIDGVLVNDGQHYHSFLVDPTEKPAESDYWTMNPKEQHIRILHCKDRIYKDTDPKVKLDVYVEVDVERGETNVRVYHDEREIKAQDVIVMITADACLPYFPVDNK